MINEPTEYTAEQEIKLRHVGRHLYQLWVDGEHVSDISGRENIFNFRERYPDAIIIAPR